MTLVLDDLELELRKLPGVRAAGFESRDDMLLVQLHVGAGETVDRSLLVEATRIAARHSDRPVAVELVRWRDSTPAPPPPEAAVGATPATGPTSAEPPAPAEGAAPGATPRRPRLLAVLSFPDTDELEVHLILEGRRTIGRSAASRDLVGAVEATIEAVVALGADVAPVTRWARAIESHDEGSVLVAVALGDERDDSIPVTAYGLAAGSSPIDAAARATLDALNRRLTHSL